MANQKDKTAAEQATVQAEQPVKAEQAGQPEPRKAETEKPGQAKPGDPLARIEQLLEKQVEQNQKILRSTKMRTFLMFVLVAVFAVVGVVFYNMLSRITEGVPVLVESANMLVTDATGDLDDVMAQINTIDFEAMNDAMDGISAIDFEALNGSIQNLEAATEAFQAFANALASPFAGLGG